MRTIIFSLITLFSLSTFSFSQEKENIFSLKKISENIYMLKGKGGNIGLNVGPKSTLMIDDQFANLSPAILEQVKSLSKNPLQYLVNTHHHGDHTGGNANMSGAGATIVAHDNVYKRLTDQEKETAMLPNITFSTDITFHFNKEPVMVLHLHNAHTDGDAIVYFTQSNVLHTGDVLFKDRYPFIDLNSGGSIQGYIKAQQTILALTDTDTKIIPGHGDLATASDLKKSITMLTSIYAKVNRYYSAGKTEAEILEIKEITASYDAQGYGDGFINTERMLKTVYADITNKAK